MESSLNEQEIGALLQKARTSTSAVNSDEQETKAISFDLRKSMQISPGQTRSITALQDSFSRRLGDSLSAYLRSTFEVTLASLEQISYSEFMKRLPDIVLLATLRIPSLGKPALLRADVPLVLQIVDMLLGEREKSNSKLATLRRSKRMCLSQ